MCNAIDRTAIRSIKNEISAENIYTTVRVERGQLILGGTLTERQRELVTAHKADLIDYLTTRPESGQCSNCKQPIEWICNKYGTWVCSCYRREQLLSTLRLYTFGYLKTSAIRTIVELKRTGVPLIDVRFNPVSSHYEWTQEILRGNLGPMYHHIPELGNELYKTALTGDFREPQIKLHNPDLGLKRLKDILDRYRRAAIFCACTGKSCHRFEVAEQATAVIPGLKIMHL